MLIKTIRYFPRQVLRPSFRKNDAVRSFVTSHPRLGKIEDDDDSWKFESFKEEPFPSSFNTEHNIIDSFSTEETMDAVGTVASSAPLRELDMSSPFDIVCSYIENIHVSMDVPYWGAIMLGTVSLRLLILPVALRIMQNGARLAHVQPLVKEKVDEANKHKDDKELYTKLMLEATGIYKEHNVNPVLSLVLPFVQMPLFVSFFFGLQRMGEIYPDYATGGTAWFTDLTLVDPTYALPIINGLTFFLVFESNNELKSRQPQMMVFFRVMALAMIPITSSFQSGVLVYWCTNNMITMLQSTVVRQDAVSKLLNIPKPPPPPEGEDKVDILAQMRKMAIEAQEKQRAAMEEQEKQKGPKNDK